jgi:hypothetical protein
VQFDWQKLMRLSSSSRTIGGPDRALNDELTTQTRVPEANLQEDTLTARSAIAKEAALHPILQLQQAIGNKAVQGLIRAKLQIGEPGDLYELEADRVADQVVPSASTVELGQKGDSGGTAQSSSENEKDRTPRLDLQRSSTNGEEDRALPALVNATLRAPGQPLLPDTRAFMESRFGYDFGGVRVHTDKKAAESAQAVNARAYTVGSDVVFATGHYAPETAQGKRLLAHELTHVAQQRPGRLARQPAPGHVLVPPPPVAVNPFEDPKAWSSAVEAAKAMVVYQSLPVNEREAAVAVSYKKNLIRVLSSLSRADQVTTFVDPLKEIARFVEEMATRETAKMSDEQIAAEEAKFLNKQAADAAQAAADAAAKAKGRPAAAATPAEIEKARKDQVAATSIQQSTTSWWATADHPSWITRGNKAIATVVAYAATKHPELALTTAQFKLDYPGIEARGANVVAAGSPAMVGKAFVTSVELNPAYVMDVVVHELFGHPEYGSYGTEYHLKLYDKAAQKIPGYTQPGAGTPGRKQELDAYAYQETEIFAVLRSMSYRTAPTAADAPNVPKLDTQALVTWHVGLMKQQWAPSLIVAILRGLRQRVLIDPRVSAAALHIFDAAVLSNFNAATLAIVSA